MLRCGFDPWAGKIPWRRKWYSTPVFFPGESQGQRSLAGYSLWTRKQSNTAKRLNMQCMSMKILKWSEVTQLYPTLCDPMDCSLPETSVHGIFQARVLEWVAISYSRVSSRPRDRTQVSCIVGRRFTVWATREAHEDLNLHLNRVDWEVGERWRDKEVVMKIQEAGLSLPFPGSTKSSFVSISVSLREEEEGKTAREGQVTKTLSSTLWSYS